MTTPLLNPPNPPPPPTIMQSSGYRLLEFREGHYVKVVDGEIVGKASLGDVYLYQNQKTATPVEAGAVEIGLAFTAVLALLFSLSWSVSENIIGLFLVFLGFKLILGLLYFVTYLATTLLLARYVYPKLPIAVTDYYSGVGRSREPIWHMSSTFYLWLMFYYPKQLFMHLFSHGLYWPLTLIWPGLRGRMRRTEKMLAHGSRSGAELAYLTLLATFVVAGLTIPVYVTIQLVFDLAKQF